MHAVIFDIDGTLLQSATVDDGLYKMSVRSVLGPVKFRPLLADYDFVTDSGILSQVMDDNEIPTNPDPVSDVQACFVEMLRSYVDENGPFQEVPGARRVLDALNRSQNHVVAIATGGWRDSALLKLESAQFDLSQIPVASSDDSIEREEIMRIALAHLGSDFDSVTYYGDGPWDRDASYSLGWKFVAVGPDLGGITSYSGVSVRSTGTFSPKSKEIST